MDHGQGRDITDFAHYPSLRGAFGALVQALGPAQELVNNAARNDRHDRREGMPEHWDQQRQAMLGHLFFAI